MFFKLQIRRLYRHVLKRVAKEVGENHLKSSAVIFSPHADDETLGCGGTIIRKRRLGAEVKIVFMTDGSASHKHLISKNELKIIRKREALAASARLGVEENNVFFLDFENRRLSQLMDLAISKVAQFLASQHPDEIFIPYSREPPSDHWATNKIVLAALASCRKSVTVYEYPLWFWHHWPWTSVSRDSYREILRGFLNNVVSGYRLIKDFRYFTHVEEVLEIKRAALNEHKSQMTKLIPLPEWKTLGEISNGEFLQCFFQTEEIFRCFSYPKQMGACV